MMVNTHAKTWFSPAFGLLFLAMLSACGAPDQNSGTVAVNLSLVMDSQQAQNHSAASRIMAFLQRWIPGGAAAWRGGASGHVYQRPMGTTVAHGTAGVQGAAVGPERAAAGGAFASGTVVKGPEGDVYAHDTTGARGVAAGPQGVAAGREFSSSSAFRGTGGATVSRGVSGAQGFAAGYGTHAWSGTYCHAQGLAGRRWCDGWHGFTAGWVGAHPWAWSPLGYAPGAWAAAAWAPAMDCGRPRPSGATTPGKSTALRVGRMIKARSGSLSSEEAACSVAEVWVVSFMN